MSDGAPELEPPPFDDDLPTREPSRPWEPYKPLRQEDLDAILSRPAHLRLHNPWLCMFNLNADDGVGYLSGMGNRQCPVQVADPTRSRYCLKHARQLGVDYYSPQETSEATDREVAGSLTRIVPKAVETLETVMDDEEAPPGIRAKAAADVLDRTGYAKGVDVRVDAQVAVVDFASIIKDRLDALAEAQRNPDVTGTGGSPPTVPGEIISGHGNTDRDPTGKPGPGADGAAPGPAR